MSSEFWAKKIGGIAQPQAPAPPPQQQGPWWQDPQQVQQLSQNPALAAQMPYQGQAGPNGMPVDQYVRQLQRMPTEDLDAGQMELIAQWELDNKPKYSQACPQCGSANYAPRGTRLGTHTLGSDKCFECGLSSSTYTGSPEPAVGGGKGSKAPYRDVRQIDTGGGAGSMYLAFRGVPAGYVPRA